MGSLFVGEFEVRSLCNIVKYNSIVIFFRINQLLTIKSQTMLKKIKAILKNNCIQWLDEIPTLELDISVKVPHFN